MLREFKNFNADVASIEDLVALSAFGELLRKEYEKNGLEEPEFVGQQLRTLRREIISRSAQLLEARAKEINARLETLKSPTQKKAELEKELAKINKQLAGTAA